MASLNFDATTVAPDTGVGDPVPPGYYNVLIDESEIKPTKSEGGLRLALRFNIMDGQYAGRKLFAGFNIKNANPVAQEIAFKQLSAVAHAVGVLNVADSSQLHNIPLKVKVKIKAASGDYDAQNEITMYKPASWTEGSTATTGPAAAGAPAPPAGFGAPPTPAAAPALANPVAAPERPPVAEGAK